MKTSIKTIAVIASTALLFSCGNKGAEQKGETTGADSTAKVDTAAKVEVMPAAKDFKYFDNLAKMITIEGLTLSSNNTYSDTASKSFAIGYDITNAAEAGADKINFMAGSVARLGNKDEVLNKSLEEYKTYQTKYLEKGVKVSDFKEYKAGDQVVYYCTFKGKSDMMGGNKNYNQLFAHYIKDDVYLDFTVTVLDKKADLAKAEAILVKMADSLTK